VGFGVPLKGWVSRCVMWEKDMEITNAHWRQYCAKSCAVVRIGKIRHLEIKGQVEEEGGGVVGRNIKVLTQGGPRKSLFSPMTNMSNPVV